LESPKQQEKNPVSEEQPILTKAQRRQLPIPLNSEESALAQQVVTTLGEDNPDALLQIEALVHRCGMAMVEQTLAETLRVEAEGGLMVTSGERRRTPGGVFLHLMSRQITPEVRRETIYLYQGKKNKGKKKAKADSPDAEAAVMEQKQPKIKPELPTWDVYRSFEEVLSSTRGVATTVKITLIGRPGAIKIQQETVMTRVEHVVKASAMPKGVPQPPTAPTIYTVYMGLKQWRKVENALKDNAQDAMIIEGVCAFDPEIQGMVVFASNTTTKGLEAAKREGQKEKTAAAEAASVKPAPARSAPSTPAPQPLTPPEPPAPPLSKYPLPPNLPPTAAQKLHDLYSAADQFRQKLATLDALPEDQRLGYAMTQKLLKNTEDQIAALEKQYKV
jgi:hypothetical protein